jgi:hypothetical protein
MTDPNRRAFLKQSVRFGAGAWLAAGFSSPGQAAEGLSVAEFEKLHKQLQPPRDEPWRTIPWKMSLLEASRLAAKEKKPVVMRVRSGHPLGCV